MRRRFPFSAIPLLLITITISSHPPPSVSAQVDDHRRICSEPFVCGNITDIRYPFWGPTRPDYCGHPEFKLNCASGTAEITINSLTYKVLEINSQSHNLKVARKDYIDNICPPVPATTSLNFTFYDYDRDLQNITLYYGCPQSNPSIPTGPETFIDTFDCGGNSGFFVTKNLDNITLALLDYFGKCIHEVIVPATQSAVKSLGTGGLTVDKLIATLQQGFGLEWHANDSLCTRCESSGGICGSNSSDGSFACYCTDRSYPESCGGAGFNQSESSGSKSRPVTVGVGVGIAGAAIVGIGLGCWILIWVQRRKRIAAQTTSKDLNTPSSKTQPATTVSFSQTTASYPSSKSDLGKGSTYFGTQVFSYEELVEATDNFNPSKELGDGGFGTVYYGVLNDGRVVAVKRLFENNMKRAEQFMNEIEILTRLRHKNLVALYGCTSKRSRELVLVYEYIPNGTVADHLHGNRSKSGLLSWKVRLSIAIETADALAFLHASDVIHRDVKTNNILLDNNFHVKVADFGLSRLFPNDVTHVSTAPQGTPGYVDPEYYQCYQLTDKSDVYSFGVILIELISSLQAVDTSRHRHDINLANMAINKIQNHALKELVDPMLGFEKDHVLRKMITSVAELAFRCLQVERDMRPTMAEVSESLKKIESEDYGSEQDLVLDIKNGEIVPLSNVALLSPNESVASDKWVSSSSITTTTASF